MIIPEHDITDVKDYIREQVEIKSLIKSLSLFDYTNGERTREKLMLFLQMGNQAINFNANIKSFIANGIIELTISDKSNSRFQKYRLTEKGRKLLK